MGITIYVSSDESGVFDRQHEKLFVYGGIVCFSKKEKDDLMRHYENVEKSIAARCPDLDGIELKASNLPNAEKGSAYRSLNRFRKFALLVDPSRLRPEIFLSKRHKQRYLDFGYKMVLKRYFEMCVKKREFDPMDVEFIVVHCDQHSTATNGRYELEEGLRNEFKYGTFNQEWDCYFPPIFPNLSNLKVKFFDSRERSDVRAADIVANHFFHLFRTGAEKALSGLDENEFALCLPPRK